MTRLFLIVSIIFSIQCYSQKKESRKKYDVNFENLLEVNHLDFDNYLFGKIKTIKYEKYVYENGNDANGKTLNKLYKTYYDSNGNLIKIENYNTSRVLQYTIINFGKGFDFWINTNSNIEIDSISKTIKETNFENGNQTITYNLDSNFKVKSVDKVINDSLKLYYFKNYDRNLLISEIYKDDSRFYFWNKNKIKHYERRRNLKKFIPNLNKIAEYSIDFTYKNDTIYIVEKSENKETKYKTININGLFLPIYEENELGIKTYFYNKDYSLYKLKYEFKDNHKIIYDYKLDSFGNYTKRFDNNKEIYSRKLSYDQNGNWITSETKENGKIIEIINKELIYY